MAKAVRETKNNLMPHVQMAAICEKVLQEGPVFSAIRVVDRFFLPNEGLPEKGNLAVLGGTILLSFKPDKAKGPRKLELHLVSPTKKTTQVGHFDVKLEGGAKGLTVKLPLIVKFEGFGQYWFDVRLDGRLCTRLPIQLSPQSDQEKQNKTDEKFQNRKVQMVSNT